MFVETLKMDRSNSDVDIIQWDFLHTASWGVK